MIAVLIKCRVKKNGHYYGHETDIQNRVSNPRVAYLPVDILSCFYQLCFASILILTESVSIVILDDFFKAFAAA